MLSCPWRRQVCIGLGAVFFFAIAFAVAGWLAAHGVLRDRTQALCDRCLIYAAAVAEIVPTWAEPSGAPDLHPLTEYAAIAGLLYVQVVSGNDVVLELAGFPQAETIMAEVPVPPLPCAALRRIEGRHFVDVTVLYMPAAMRDDTGTTRSGPPGRLRLGIDASALAWAAANTRALAAGLAALAWIASSALACLFLRPSRRAAAPEGSAHEPVTPGGRVARAGELALHIDEARLVVAGRSVRLTPKQLDLLKVLMGDPGRTFSDEEILSQAWSRAPYADSKDVKQYVYLIRQRLNSVELPGDRILANVPGVGYRIDPAAVDGLIERAVDSAEVETRFQDGSG